MKENITGQEIMNCKKQQMYELPILISQYAEVEVLLKNVQEGMLSSEFCLLKREFWGKRNLAYSINKIKKADYHVVYFSATIDALKALEKKLKMTQDVLRFLVLKIKELPISNPPIMAGLLTSENVDAINNLLELSNDSSRSEEEIAESNAELALNWISYKNPDLLLRYISDIYLISSRKFNGLTAMQQRTLKTEIGRARFLSILPFTIVRKR